MSRLARRLLPILVVLGAPLAANGQAAPGITDAYVNSENPTQILVDFDGEYDAIDARNIHVFEIATGTAIAVTGVNKDNPETPGQKIPISAATIDTGVNLLPPVVDQQLKSGTKPKSRYYIVFVGLTVKEKSQPPVTALVNFEAPSSTPLLYKKASNRADANVYIAGMISGTRGGKTNSSIDLKAEYPFRPSGSWYLAPFVSFKASTSDPNADLNSLVFGLRTDFTRAFALSDDGPADTGSRQAEVRGPRSPDAPPDQWFLRRADGRRASLEPVAPQRNRPFVGYDVGNAFQLEVDRDFRQVNFIHQLKFTLVSRVWQAGALSIYVRPYVGNEIGRSLLSVMDGAAGRLIDRPLAGITVSANIPFEASSIEGLSFDSTYVNRWPLRSEVSQKIDATKARIPFELGTSPKPYWQSQFQVRFSKLFALTVTYENGQLPPLFQKVEHKASLGFTFQQRVER